MIRHRIKIRDLSLIAVAALVACYWVYAVDVFKNEPGISKKKEPE